MLLFTFGHLELVALDFPFADEGTLDHLVIFTQNLDGRRNLSFPFRNSSSKKHFESIKTSKAIERDFTCLIVGTHFMCNVIKCHYFSTPEINSKLSLRDDTTLLQAHQAKRTGETKTIIVQTRVAVRYRKEAIDRPMCQPIYRPGKVRMCPVPSSDRAIKFL